MIKIIPIHSYKNNIDSSISFKLHNSYNSLYIDKNKYSILFNKFNKNDKNNNLICFNIINQQYNNINKYSILQSSSLIKTIAIEPFYRIYYLNYIKNNIIKKDENNLLLSNVFSLIYELNNMNIKFDTIMFENEDSDQETYDDYFNKLSKINNMEFISIFDKIDNNNHKKYNNIIIYRNIFYYNIYISLFGLTKIPYIILSTLKSLKKLNNNGNLVLFTPKMYINNAIKWLIQLLTNIFNSVDIINDDSDPFSYMVLINCIGFNSTNQPRLNEIIELFENEKSFTKYNYSFCEFIHYYITITSSNSELFNNNFNIYPINSYINKKFKILNVIDDINIDIPIKSSFKSEIIIYQLQQIYNQQIDIINYNINKNLSIDQKNPNNIIVNKFFLKQIEYNKIQKLVNYYESHNIPYNKSYLTYIDKFNKNIINQLYSYKHLIKHKIIKYNSQSISTKKTSHLSKHKKTQRHKKESENKNNQILNKINIQKESYHYDNFNKMNDLNTMAYKVKLNLLENIGNEMPRQIKQATEDFARGVPSYLMKNHKLHYPVSNAFCKLWEMLNNIDGLLPIKANPKIFFIAEAPGQWIYSSNLYYQTNNKNKEKDKNIGLEWRANTLNPKNKLNIEKFGKDIFDDQYGFMKKYPDRWIYGVDDTGDITKSENQRWFKQYAKEFGHIDLVTGDAGIFSDNPLIFQKLDYAQVCMVASVSSLGGNCVIKHFLPYVRRAPISYYGYGLFINYLFLYHLMFNEFYLVKPLTSNPDSGEFYVVCKGFKGISDDQYQKLLHILDNFEVNMCFFNRKDIPDEFVNQVMEFVDKLLNMNVEHSEITNLLLTCMIHKNPVIEEKTNCSKYLDKKYIEKIHNEKFNEWVKNNKFDV